MLAAEKHTTVTTSADALTIPINAQITRVEHQSANSKSSEGVSLPQPASEKNELASSSNAGNVTEKPSKSAKEKHSQSDLLERGSARASKGTTDEKRAYCCSP